MYYNHNDYAVSGGHVSLIQGSYEYHHYLQDGFDDSLLACCLPLLERVKDQRSTAEKNALLMLSQCPTLLEGGREEATKNEYNAIPHRIVSSLQ
ncbi:hypothetical protein ACS0TY_018375 [Phlomoides rotata]